MQFLPIVERELRAAAHHSRTWWRRILTLLAALVILTLTWLSVGRWASLSQVGHSVFGSLGIFAFIYALFAGPLATADCLSRERRDGTLGLLFLTDLRGYDVVLGKIAASSLDVMLGLLAALPLLAMPLLAGGVTLAQFSLLVLALADVMVLSLAIGVFCSSLLDSGRASLALTVGIILFLTLGVPFIGEELLKVGSRSPVAPFFYSICPLWVIMLCLNPPGTPAGLEIWPGLVGFQALAWLLVAAACFRTARCWRDVPLSNLRLWWRRRLERLRCRKPDAAMAWRRSFLEKNPVGWIEGRDRVQERVLALLICGCALFWALKHLRSPQTSPPPDAVFLWPVFTHYLMCLWICIQAPRRYADDKQSGALELLLCTTLPVRQIVQGVMSTLWRRFGRAVVALVLLDAFLVQAHVSEHGGWSNSPGKELLPLCVCATLVFLIQGYVFACVGLYQGLAKANSLRATFSLIWTLGLLPWAVFVASIMACDLGRRYFGFLPRITEKFLFILWAGVHLLIFAAFLTRASWQLRYNFRHLAAGTTTPLWKRAWEALREDFD